MTLSAGAGEAAGTAHGIAGLETRPWGFWGSQPSVPPPWCVSLGWMGVWDSRSGGPAWIPWWLSISSKLTSNYMVNGITVKSSSLSSPGLNAPLGQRHLMALWAGSSIWKSLSRGYFCSPSPTANLRIHPKWNKAGKCSCVLSVAESGWTEPCWCGMGR